MEGIATEIDRRLAAARVPSSPNEMTAAELRGWAVEYLAEYDEEVAQFPQLAGKPHWNLWMIDREPADALFAVLVFRPDGVEFACGTGESYPVRRWSENVAGDPAGLIAEMGRQFKVTSESLSLGQEAAAAWLGRTW